RSRIVAWHLVGNVPCCCRSAAVSRRADDSAEGETVDRFGCAVATAKLTGGGSVERARASARATGSHERGVAGRGSVGLRAPADLRDGGRAGDPSLSGGRRADLRQGGRPLSARLRVGRLRR